MIDKQTVYIVGVVTPGDKWMCEGIYFLEKDAIENCKRDEFIVPVKIPGRLPDKATDAKYLWWPHKSTKKEAIEIMNQARIKEADDD